MTWVLWEAQVGPRKLIAWCLTDSHDVGYTRIAYTTIEGDPVDAPDDPRFTRVLATMPGPPAPDEQVEVFTDEFLVPRNTELLDVYEQACRRCSASLGLGYAVSIDRRRRRWPFRHDVVIATLTPWTDASGNAHAVLHELKGTRP